MRNPVTFQKLKYGAEPMSPRGGDLVEVRADGWMAVFYESAGRPAEDTCFALRYLHEQLPLAYRVSFDARGSVLEYKADAALPATVEGRTIRFTDLDLDLVVTPDFAAALLDLDEFEERCTRLAYPTETVAQAWAGIALAREALAERAFPFDGAPEALLGRVLASMGPL